MTVTRRGRRILRLGLGLIVVLAVAAAGGCGCATPAWSRSSDVQITGVTASDGEQVKAALESAALEMTTLHVRPQGSRTRPRACTSVDSVEVATDFPHTLRIHVIERRPVAALATKEGEAPDPGHAATGS